MVKYSPINQFIKDFSPSMAVNSYLHDNVEGKQFYFSFGSFSTQRSLNLGFKSRFGDLINANFAFKYLYRHKQKFANKRLCIYTE